MLEGGRWDDSTLGVKKLGGWRQRVVKRGWRSPGKVCVLFGAAYVLESVSFESLEGESEVGRHTHVLNFFFFGYLFSWDVLLGTCVMDLSSVAWCAAIISHIHTHARHSTTSTTTCDRQRVEA